MRPFTFSRVGTAVCEHNIQYLVDRGRIKTSPCDPLPPPEWAQPPRSPSISTLLYSSSQKFGLAAWFGEYHHQLVDVEKNRACPCVVCMRRQADNRDSSESAKGASIRVTAPTCSTCSTNQHFRARVSRCCVCVLVSRHTTQKNRTICIYYAFSCESVQRTHQRTKNVSKADTQKSACRDPSSPLLLSPVPPSVPSQGVI